MEIVSVKLVVFKQKTFHEEGEYCGYCPALNAFHVFNSFEKVLYYMQDRLKRDLEGRIHYRNLKNRGWKITENSAIPPIFADEELIKQSEKCFEVEIKKPLIIELYAELPPTKDRYFDLSNLHKDI